MRLCCNFMDKYKYGFEMFDMLFVFIELKCLGEVLV